MATKRKWQQTIDWFNLSAIIPSRLQQLIDIMQRVKDQGSAFNMTIWQHNTDGPLARTQTELHKCGYTACLGGWLAVSSEFQAVGGWVDNYGTPKIDEYEGAKAINYFLQNTGRIQRDGPGKALSEYLAYPSYGLYEGVARDAKTVIARLRYIQKSLETA